MKDWEKFVLAYGWQTRAYDMAAAIGQPVAEIERVRRTGACTKRKELTRFAELFTLWRGRPPKDTEWPAPRKLRRSNSSYEWQAPEIALLATLVGTLGKPEIATILTKRLRERTGDRKAVRSENGVQLAVNRVGMLMSDVVGGITASAAGREINSYATVFHSIKDGKLPARKVGRVLVIPHAAWAKWKSTRVFPPKGYMMLSKLKRPLGINSDKLSEWARLGYVPTALRCTPYGSRSRGTKFGTWWIDRKFAAKLIADRRAGRPMPWWGKPEPCNLRVTWKLLQKRKHPASCATCAQIWGKKGRPTSYEDYAERYPALAFGAKRHLTRKWTLGLTIDQVAELTGRSRWLVRLAITNKVLPAKKDGRCFYITRTDATRWKARKCGVGDRQISWISLSNGQKLYQFSLKQIRAFIADGKLRSKIAVGGPMRGHTYVLQIQLSRLREKIGFTEAAAARRLKLSITRLRKLLKGVNWRGAARIPLDTVNAVAKRKYSQDTGLTIDEAAKKLGVTFEWVHERVIDGTIRILRGKWDRRRTYITQPMFERLKAAKAAPKKAADLGPDWLFLSEAAREIGVSTSMVVRWNDDGELAHRESPAGKRYHRRTCRTRARRYWKTQRLHRAMPPAWLREERARGKASA